MYILYQQSKSSRSFNEKNLHYNYLHNNSYCIQVPLYILKLLSLFINHKNHPANRLSIFDSLVYNQILSSRVSCWLRYGSYIAIDSIFPASRSPVASVSIASAGLPRICCKDKIWKTCERSCSCRSFVSRSVYRDSTPPSYARRPRSLNPTRPCLKDNPLEYHCSWQSVLAPVSSAFPDIKYILNIYFLHIKIDIAKYIS